MTVSSLYLDYGQGSSSSIVPRERVRPGKLLPLLLLLALLLLCSGLKGMRAREI